MAVTDKVKKRNFNQSQMIEESKMLLKKERKIRIKIS